MKFKYGNVVLAVATALFLSSTAFAGGPGEEAAAETPAAAPASTAEEKLGNLLGQIDLTGFVEASYVWSSAEVPGSNIVGRSFDRFDNEFTLNAFQLGLSKPIVSDAWDAGFVTKLFFGQNAKLIQSAGLDLGSNGDLQEAYISLNAPIGNGLQFKVGKMVTLMGVEVIEDIVNPVWSEGNQFLFLENFTNLGGEVSYKWSDLIDTQFRVFNGWDVVDDNNGALSFMGRLGINPGPDTVISIIPYGGPEQSKNENNYRKGIDVVVSQHIGENAIVLFQGDYGAEDNAAPAGGDAEWWALGLWGKYDFTEKYGIGVRADYMDDIDGARTSGSPFTAPYPANNGNKVWTLTVAGNLRPWENVLIRPEIRYDDSSLSNAYGDDSSQVSIGASVAYILP